MPIGIGDDHEARAMQLGRTDNQTPKTGDLRRRFARLTFTNIISNITVPLASLVDTALLGHLESIRFLAGVALAAVIFEYVYWSFGFLRMGTTGTTAQALTRLFRLNRDILLRTVALISAFATESLAGILAGTGDRKALRRLQRLALKSGVVLGLPGGLHVGPSCDPLEGVGGFLQSAGADGPSLVIDRSPLGSH